MSRMGPIIKREFTEAASSKAFIIGTILGPLLIFAMFGLQFLVIAKGGGGEHRMRRSAASASASFSTSRIATPARRSSSARRTS